MERCNKGHTLDRIDNDGDYEPSNCKWSTRTEQQRNRKMDIRNTTGYTGVKRVKGKWVAVIFVERKNRHLGTFDTKELAVQARNDAEIKYRGSVNKNQTLAENGN